MTSKDNTKAAATFIAKKQQIDAMLQRMVALSDEQFLVHGAADLVEMGLHRGGWHTTDKLRVPKNITLILLPSRSPELNPVENIWQYLRANWLSNRVFEAYPDIIEAACDAWKSLTAAPVVITSIGMRDWAHIGQE